MTTSLENPQFDYKQGAHKTITITGSLYPDDIYTPYKEHFREGDIEAWPLKPDPAFYNQKAEALANDSSIESATFVATSAGTLFALKAIRYAHSLRAMPIEAVLIDPYFAKWKSPREEKRRPLSTLARERMVAAATNAFPKISRKRFARQIAFLAHRSPSEALALPESLEGSVQAGLLIESSKDMTRGSGVRTFLKENIPNLEYATVEAGHAKLLPNPNEPLDSPTQEYLRYLPPIADYFSSKNN